MRWVSGNSVIEMSYIMPLFFSLFVIIIHTVFYYHDKNILMGTAYEAAVVHSQKKRSPEACTIAEAEQSFEIAARKKVCCYFQQ